jgi:transposase
MEKKVGAPRLVEANRQQTRLVPMDLEGLLPADHQARAVWSFVSRLNLIEFHERIQSREGSAGRPATDPQILLALWILATLDGVGSAREIARLCDLHLAYQWVCGGVPVNHHTLSDFRNLSTDQLSGLLTQSVSGLLSEGLVEMQRVAHDGMKVRASAGSSSFRRRARLKELRKLAKEQVETLRKEIDDDSGAASRREQGARKRAAEERERRVEEALKQLAKDEEESRTKDRKRDEKREKRTSVTDPQARMMKMADGGYRPAYNVHLATTTERGVIVAVNVNNASADQRAMLPLAADLEDRYGVHPTEWLADGGCTSNANIEAMSERGCKVYAPVRERNAKPTRKDSTAIVEWRERMASEDAKSIYKLRGQTAEWVNARFRGQGLTQLFVRGLEKVRAVALLHAITHNFRHGMLLQT